MMFKFDVLAVDDEQVVVDGIEKILGSDGFKVDKSLTGKEALEKLRKNEYRAIICDIMLPAMDGFQFLEKMREMQITTPVIMATGFSTLENAVRSLAEGAVDFIPKPFSVEEILAPVHRAVKYSELLKMMNAGGPGSDELMPFVPCPAKYYKLGYSSWALLENDGSAVIGATDLFLKTIGEFENVQLSGEGNEILQGSPCAGFTVEDELVHNFLCPLSGRIIEKNGKVEENNDILLKDPYFEGWLYRIIPSDMDYEFEKLSPCSSDRM